MNKGTALRCLLIVAATGMFNPCFAQSCDCDQTRQTEQEELVIPWADAAQAPAPNVKAAGAAPNLYPYRMPRSSRRTNTNLSAYLPATVTCSVSVNVLDDRDYTKDYAAVMPPELPMANAPALPLHPRRGSVNESGF